MNTCKRFESLSSCIYYKPIDKFACKTYKTSYTVITSVNTQWWKAKLVLKCIRVKCWVTKYVSKRRNLCLYRVCSYFSFVRFFFSFSDALPAAVIDGRHEHTFIWLIYLFPHYFRRRSCRHHIHTHSIPIPNGGKKHGSKVRKVECFGFVDFSLLVLFPTMDRRRRWWWWFDVCSVLYEVALLSCGLPFASSTNWIWITTRVLIRWRE